MNRSYKCGILFFTVFLLLAGAMHPFPLRAAEIDPEESSSEHVHDFTERVYDDEYHWFRCSVDGCDEISEKTAHALVEANDSSTHWTFCECGYESQHENHNFEWVSTEEKHWQRCTLCGYETAKEDHEPGPEATDKEPQVCLICDYELVSRRDTHTAKIHYDNSECLDFEFTDDYAYGDGNVATKLYKAYETEKVELRVTDPKWPSIEIVDSILFYDVNGELSKDVPTIYVEGEEVVYFEMPDHDILIQVVLEVSEEKAEESAYAASASLEESIALESSIQESIAASKRFRYGHYLVESDVSSVTPPKNFIRANDVTNFERTVGCFYSTDYRIFVYYASANERDYDYYVLDRIGQDLIPFVTFPGTGNNSYVVSAPASERDIPGIYRQETDVKLQFASGAESVTVPAFLTLDEDGNTLTLLYLNDDSGNQQFFVYDNSKGTVELTEYERYLERKKTGVSDGEGMIVITTAAETEAAKPGKTELSRGMIWLIIVGVIIVLLAAALITVFIMSKQQEARERELDEEDDELFEEPEPETTDSEITEALTEDDEIPETFDTALYQNPDPKDMDAGKEAADFDFENAFPGMSADVDAAPAPEAEAPVTPAEAPKKTDISIDFEEITDK